MIKLIGKEGCNRCVMTKNILNNKGVKFEYMLLNELPKEEQDKYVNMAQESGNIELPLIIKDEKIITLQEI